MVAPPEEPLGRAPVPTGSVGVLSGWASAVGLRAGGSGSSSSGGLPLPGHQLVLPPRASLVTSSVTLATTAASSGADPATSVVSTVARVATDNRLLLPPPVPDSLQKDASTTLGWEGEDWLELLVGHLCSPLAGFPTSVLTRCSAGRKSLPLGSWARTCPPARDTSGRRPPPYTGRPW